MSDPIAEAVAFLADDLDVPVRDVRRAFERAEARGILTVRVVDEPEPEPSDHLAEVRRDGRGRCLCPIATIERVLIDRGTCGRGGCPYGGDF